MHRFFIILLVLCITTVSKAEERLPIDAKVNGKALRLVFDTGAERSVIFRHVAERLDLSVTDMPQGTQVKSGKVLMGISEECRITILNSTWTGRFAVLDIPSFLTRDIDGVLSWKIVQDSIFRIDADNKKITGLTTLPNDIDHWSKWDLLMDSNLLAFHLPRTSKQNGTVLIDTGSHMGVELNHELWEIWKKENSGNPLTLVASGTPANPIQVSSEYWATQLTIGNFSINNIPVIKAAPEAKHIFENHLATLGLFALTRLDVIIDNKNGTIYTRKKRNPKTSYQHNQLGAVFVPKDMKGKDLIAHVAEGSPAYSAGIRNGDILLSIDNLDVTKWRTDPGVLPLSRFFNKPAGTKHRLSLERKGERFQALVILKDIFDQNNLVEKVSPKY
jgi:hypothetical protein